MKDLSNDYGSRELLYSYFKSEIKHKYPNINSKDLEYISKNLTDEYDAYLNRIIENYISDYI